MNLKKYQQIIEGLLFAAGDRVSIEKICEVIGTDKKTARLVLNNMIVNYDSDPSRGITIREINKGYQMCSKPELYQYIKILFEPRQKSGLSQAALETLAIIAFNRPITKARIEKIRGVNSDSSIEKLLEKNLIRECGRLDAPGRPLLYETTEEFFRCFGFKSDSDLPIFEFNEIKQKDAEQTYEDVQVNANPNTSVNEQVNTDEQGNKDDRENKDENEK
ncbi:SMC-Scp complex subunit ScpB [Acetivibrio saccincola]|jgi:segregation and condensation protein B|uniref:Segregation and condensation protein B n=1 Tax=Acetivibrio saccincola TaxID=1677857 RepID=A0A2K9E1D7_9FIRM|nr:SMC-Scp complex subunit ScpB [Acetivibrio saccincola]AUG57582.1 Segregation and condensation protein B [Acetivibrio saccincola]NLW26873.1 SMC-Scp complex subunit ScpB [Acetivibrio saccincola]PQQ67492.1 SMC-Scp complex subunit ScpB [Acetivibrio saccincola]HOA96461.1 SMC-Scp complex subunit ScpB [Acetivibrio saccincola]HQD28764.1 SMC-Scp complex subunit ScpB [Acetivibrio saccincola]